jgi:Tfp pilus assembly protein PilF
MRKGLRNARTLWIALAAAAALAVVLVSCNRNRPPNVPSPKATDFKKAVAKFYIGLSALDVGNSNLANPVLAEFTKLAPDEPAGWANWGLFALRSAQNDAAAERIKKALELAPNNSKIRELNAILLSRQGKSPEAIAEFRKAVELDPKNLRAANALAQELERQGGPQGEADAQAVLTTILEKRPDNVAVLLEVIRLAAKRGDTDTLKSHVARLLSQNRGFPAKAIEYVGALQKAAAGGNSQVAATQVVFVKNTMQEWPVYRAARRELNPDSGEVAKPIRKPLTLAVPPPTPAAPDEGITFAADNRADPKAQNADVVRAVVLAPELPPNLAQNFQTMGVQAAAESQPTVLQADARAVRLHSPSGAETSLPFPGGLTPPAHAGLLAVDLNYDFRNDLVFAGGGGLKMYQQSQAGTFTDVTARAKLPASVATGRLYGVWPIDVDLDGDLDLLVAPVSGVPMVLRNNADGTYKPLEPFGVQDVRDFALTDVDADGEPDPAFVTADGRLRVFANERSGVYRERKLPEGLTNVDAVTVADLNRDGVLDFVVLRDDGALVRLSDKDEGMGWETAEVARWASMPPVEIESDHPARPDVNQVRLLAADLDNNGGIDLLASRGTTSQVFLSDAQLALKPLATAVPGTVHSVWLMNNDDRLDLVTVTPEGRPLTLMTSGTKRYFAQTVRPRATFVARTTDPRQSGDSRINPFGIGGEMETRSALLAQKLPIDGPTLHFGMGEQTTADVIRIVWPNGLVNAEFPSSFPQPIVAVQRLSGSCPWLFAWDGAKMGFVTDFIWRSPLGLRINAQDTAGVMTTEDWVKIRGDQLAARDGYYDLRITAELWETHFFDYVSLMTVDHPAGTEVYVDERFAFPPDTFKVYVTGPSKPVAKAVDDNGTDVSEVVSARDGRYLDTFGRGQYQGVTRDHWVEVELPADAPETGPLYLVCYGWIHPTDSSVNVALSQGDHPKPQGIRVEVPDGSGGWRVAKPNIGFPSGKTKTILVPLESLFKPGVPRRVRLGTNLEVYWDSIHVAAGMPDAQIKTRRILPTAADLRYRGFSATAAVDKSSPELPDYHDLKATTQQWRDLIGYHTRFGDVRELLQKVDDRYVIMNAGDEMAFRFPEAAPPPASWVRDYVFIGDGWEKDGNLNTGFSKTVLPLPSHTDPKYNRPPGRLEDDPVYKRYPRDWQVYHTRFVAPDRFRSMPGYAGEAE